MNQFFDSSVLLGDVIENTKKKNQHLLITNLSGLLSHAKISPGTRSDDVILKGYDKYFISLFEELYREVRFYYHQLKMKGESAMLRLTRALIGLARTIEKSDFNNLEIFLKSISKDVECAWFIISSYTDYPKVVPDVFKAKLFEYIKNANQLNNKFKTALQHSRAGTLSNQIKSVFACSTPATKLDLLDILGERQEADKQWLRSIQKESDPALKTKIDNLLNKDK